MNDDVRREAREAVEALNRCWLEGRVEDLREHLDPHVVEILPEFTGRTEGLEGVLQGFRDFLGQCTVRAFATDDWHVDLRPEVAIVAYAFDLLYERAGEEWRAVGRDLWVMRPREGDRRWVGVWRTVLGLEETPAP